LHVFFAYRDLHSFPTRRSSDLVIADSLRAYKSSSWLVGRPACAGGGYDAAVYEGTFGFLTTVDVMHEYGYFEINRVPWFFRSAIDRKSTRLNSSHLGISYAVFC